MRRQLQVGQTISFRGNCPVTAIHEVGGNTLGNEFSCLKINEDQHRHNEGDEQGARVNQDLPAKWKTPHGQCKTSLRLTDDGEDRYTPPSSAGLELKSSWDFNLGAVPLSG